MNMEKNRIHHLKVCGEPGQYAGWPANGGMWAWGNELLVGFALGKHKEQPGHSRDAASMRDTLARSLDGGETWSIEPGPAASNIEPTHAKADTEAACPGTTDFTSPGFALTFRGATFFLSDDRGRHWQGPWRFPNVEGQRIQGRTDYLVEGPRTLLAMLTVTKQDGLEGRVGAFRTEDGGGTWKRVAWVGPEPAGFSIMPATVRLSPSRLLTVLRCRTAGTHRWLAYEVSEDCNWLESWLSDDNGASWRQVGRPVDDTGWGGNPAALVRLADGRICMAYAWRGFSLEQSSRMCVRYSANDGLSWSDEVVVRSGDGANQDVGYPRMCQRPDGKLVLLYYYNHAFRDAPSWRYIAATVFDPA
jgi:hypothetical protein